MIRKVIFVLLLGALLILQLHNVTNFPTNRGFDARDHIAYVSYLKAHHRIPTANEGWELYQPPLYYLNALLFPTVSSVKILGLIAWLTLLTISFIFLKKTEKSTNSALMGTFIIGSLPVIIYLTPVIGNEFFSSVLISITMVYYLMTKNIVKTGIFLGLAMLAKATSFILLIAIIFDYLVSPRCNRKKLISSLLIILLISGWFYGRNLLLFKNPFVSSVDFPQYKVTQNPGYRDWLFFTDLSGFIKMDLFRAHHYSLWAGTYFSWFYDGHNVIVPVQSYSKIGILLLLFSLPLLIFFLIGYFLNLKNVTDTNRLLIIYPLLLFIAYIFYNFKLPFYSTVKGSFLVSAVIPFVYFILQGIKKFRNFRYFSVILNLYLILYCMIIIKNFWILSPWYKQ